MALPKVRRGSNPLSLKILLRLPANHQGLRFSLPPIATLTKPIMGGFSTEQETERLVADPAPGITAEPHEDNLRYFDVTIKGPDGSPFQSTSPYRMVFVIAGYSRVIQTVFSVWNCSYLKNTRWRPQKCGF